MTANVNIRCSCCQSGAGFIETGDNEIGPHFGRLPQELFFIGAQISKLRVHKGCKSL